MRTLPRRRVHRPVPWAAIARAGQVHWFCGNLYEAVVDMPRLLADAHPNRVPGVLRRGSPLRYYAPAAPLTLAATAGVCVDSWRSGGNRVAAISAAAGTASATALSVYLIQTVNIRLLRSREPLSAAERDRLGTTWHRANLARLVALAVAAQALRALPHAGPTKQARQNSLP